MIICSKFEKTLGFVRGLFLLPLLLVVAGCGDWGVGDDDVVDVGPTFREHYHYYYAQECYWMSGEYFCGSPYSLPKALVISVKIEYNDNATVYYDGSGPYLFWYDEYVYDFDRGVGDYYYQFNLSGNILTVYENGSEAIYSDDWTGMDYHYYYDIW